MEYLQLLKTKNSDKSLIKDDYYYKNIFKKSEKITCAVFYITKKITTKDNQKHTDHLETVASDVLDTVLGSLSAATHTCDPQLESCAHVLVRLDSKLRVTAAAGHIAPDILHTLCTEIDSVLRSLEHFKKQTVDALHDAVPALQNNTGNQSNTRTSRTTTAQSSRQGSAATGATLSNKTPTSSLSLGTAPASQTTSVSTASQSGADRTARLLTLLGDGQPRSIKDIAAAFPDCSEKTVQRLLNSLINKGQIFRKGERRWSTYSLS